MNIVIMGAGAIGSLFGAFLSKKNDVVLIGRSSHVNAINKNGLTIKGKTQFNVKIRAVDSADKIPFSPDLIIITVKSYDTETAIKEIKEEVGLEKNDVNLVKQYGPVKFSDIYEGESYDWEIYVFVFIIKKNSKINIDWEHIEKKWILPSEIGEYNTVPFLKEIVYKILL